MARKSASIGLAILLAAVIAVGYASWTIYRDNRTEYCEFSARHVHAQTKAVAMVNGEEKVFCCPACAFTLRAQTGQSVNFLELTDYETARPLAPEGAFVVLGSEVNMCVTQHMLLDENRQAAPMDFDRCMPSLVAFARKEAAEHFLQVHDGTLISFQELTSDSNR